MRKTIGVHLPIEGHEMVTFVIGANELLRLTRVYDHIAHTYPIMDLYEGEPEKGEPDWLMTVLLGIRTEHYEGVASWVRGLAEEEDAWFLGRIVGPYLVTSVDGSHELAIEYERSETLLEVPTH